MLRAIFIFFILTSCYKLQKNAVIEISDYQSSGKFSNYFPFKAPVKFPQTKLIYPELYNIEKNITFQDNSFCGQGIYKDLKQLESFSKVYELKLAEYLSTAFEFMDKSICFDSCVLKHNDSYSSVFQYITKQAMSILGSDRNKCCRCVKLGNLNSELYYKDKPMDQCPACEFLKHTVKFIENTEVYNKKKDHLINKLKKETQCLSDDIILPLIEKYDNVSYDYDDVIDRICETKNLLVKTQIKNITKEFLQFITSSFNEMHKALKKLEVRPTPKELKQAGLVGTQLDSEKKIHCLICSKAFLKVHLFKLKNIADALKNPFDLSSEMAHSLNSLKGSLEFGLSYGAVDLSMAKTNVHGVSIFAHHAYCPSCILQKATKNLLKATITQTQN